MTCNHVIEGRRIVNWIVIGSRFYFSANENKTYIKRIIDQGTQFRNNSRENTCDCVHFLKYVERSYLSAMKFSYKVENVFNYLGFIFNQFRLIDCSWFSLLSDVYLYIFYCIFYFTFSFPTFWARFTGKETYFSVQMATVSLVLLAIEFPSLIWKSRFLNGYNTRSRSWCKLHILLQIRLIFKDHANVSKKSSIGVTRDLVCRSLVIHGT